MERLRGAYTGAGADRVVAATNRDLQGLVEARKFRPDLYYRLCGEPLRIPDLAERPRDVPLLLRYFLVRVERAEVPADGEGRAIGVGNCDREEMGPERPGFAARVAALERELIEEVLERTGWNRTQAAEHLGGMKRTTLIGRMQQLGVRQREDRWVGSVVHVTSDAKQPIEDEETGGQKYRYVRTGADHFSLALTYDEVAGLVVQLWGADQARPVVASRRLRYSPVVRVAVILFW